MLAWKVKLFFNVFLKLSREDPHAFLRCFQMFGYHLLGELQVRRYDDMGVVDGEPHAPDGQPSDLRNFQFSGQGQKDIFVPGLLQTRRVLLHEKLLYKC